MTTEIERKFLVNSDFKHLALSNSRIMQAYLLTSKEKTVRIRIRGDKAYITIKGQSTQNGLSRFEWEKEISIEEAHQLLTLAEPGIIDKVRYIVPNSDGIHFWEVDEFFGDNEGLLLAEIELQDENETIDIPEWIGEEVTGDKRFYNSYLKEHPFKEWRNYLDSFAPLLFK